MRAATQDGEQGIGLQAGWIRRRYIIRGGYLCSPPGTTHEAYDPFEAYYGSDAARPGRSLYQELVELDTEDERAIEDFASRWGLLGMFQHRLVQVRHVDGGRSSLSLPPNSRLSEHIIHLSELYEWPGVPADDAVFVTISDAPDVRDFLEDDEVFGRTEPEGDIRQWLLERGFAQLASDGSLTLDDSQDCWDQLERFLSDRNGVLLDAWYERQHFPEGSVLVQTDDGIVAEQARSDYYRRYFPFPRLWREGLPELPRDVRGLSTEQLIEVGRAAVASMDLQHPRLSSPAFWHALCEPLEEFRSAAAALRETYALCDYVSKNPIPKPSPFLPDSDFDTCSLDAENRSSLRKRFTQHLRRVSPIPRYDERTAGWSWSWSFPSLLSAAYVMMFLDFAVEKRKLRFCSSETCGKTFVTERSDRKYCSDTCQNSQKQREFRRAKKARANTSVTPESKGGQS